MNAHHKARQHKLRLVPWLLLAITTTVVGTIIALPSQDSRGIFSDDFTKNRPAAKSTDAPKGSQRQSASGATAKPKPHRYRLASQPTKKPGPRTNGQSSLDNIIAQLGITLWRLRSVKATGSDTRALIREKGASPSWVPERVEADTTFREGDHVRLTVESPRVGYLYVVDRDLFIDGTTGGAMLIYPWAGVDNQVHPGKLVDIPSQDDDPSYFTARLTSTNQIGELLTFIVTASPLDLPISNKPFQISNVQMSKWESLWGGATERFEMEGGAGEAWTKHEQQAAAKKGTRQLTRDDPAPQTIYRVSPADSKAFLVNVRLRYSK